MAQLIDNDDSSESRHMAKPDGGVQFGILGRVLCSLVAMAILVIGVGGWAATAELSGAVISQGAVIVDGRAKKIQHREGGVVAAINIRNGDRVKQGDALIVLDGTQMNSELAIVQSQLVELRARHARLVAERSSEEAIVFPEDLVAIESNEDVIRGEQRLFLETRATRESQKQQLELRVSQLQKEGEGVGAQMAAKKKELSFIERELADVRDLYNRKLTPATRLYALEREQTRLAGEQGSLAANVARLGGQISETKLQILNIDQTARADAQRELRNAEARMAELREREIALRDRLSHLVIKSPRNGVIHELQAHTIGGVVTPAEPIMMVVPDDKLLSIEVRISPAEVDQVYVGQAVRIRFSAFNQRITPEKTGTISMISADVTHDPKNRTDYYSATVKLDLDDDLAVGGQPVVPGMPVEAFITTTKRTALSYFVKPLTDHFSRALREE